MLPPCSVDEHGHGRDAADGDDDEGGEQHPGVVAHQPRHQYSTVQYSTVQYSTV